MGKTKADRLSRKLGEMPKITVETANLYSACYRGFFSFLIFLGMGLFWLYSAEYLFTIPDQSLDDAKIAAAGLFLSLLGAILFNRYGSEYSRMGSKKTAALNEALSQRPRARDFIDGYLEQGGAIRREQYRFLMDWAKGEGGQKAKLGHEKKERAHAYQE